MPAFDRPAWHADYFKQKDLDYQMDYTATVPGPVVGQNHGKHASYLKNNDQYYEVRRDDFNKQHQKKWSAIKDDFIVKNAKKHYGALTVTNIQHIPTRFRTFDRIDARELYADTIMPKADEDGEGTDEDEEDEEDEEANHLEETLGALPGVGPLNNRRADPSRGLVGYSTMSSTLTPIFEKQRKNYSTWQQPTWMGARRGTSFQSMTMSDYGRPAYRRSNRTPTPTAPHKLGYGTDLTRGNHPQSYKHFATLKGSNGMTINTCLV